MDDLLKIKEKREEARLKELGRKTKELEKSRTALMNILEDEGEARRKAEEEKDKTLTIITNFADGLLVFNQKNILSLINPQAEVFFEIKAQEIIGKSLSELIKFPKFSYLEKIFDKEIKEVFRKELKIRESLILEASTVSLIRENEKIGNLVIFHDVTREKEIEKTKSEFVSITAHQLRTPLSGIKWTLKMLLDEDLGKITEEQRDFIEKTYKANERVITVINDLLNLTRIEEGRYFYKLILVNIEDIIEEIVIFHKEIAEKRGVKLEFQKPKEKLLQVKIDVEKIKIVIQNLIENAIHYTKEGGQVTISLKYAKNEIEFKVRDTGIGIPKDQQYRLFTKFFRTQEAIAMETDGSGLGLFITKNIIEAHQGRIWFESEKDKGSTFYFTLPVENNLL